VAVPTALLDACVIYPAPLRDLLMYLAVENVYQPRWSNISGTGGPWKVRFARPGEGRGKSESYRACQETKAALNAAPFVCFICCVGCICKV
jgi:hypothetical protein